MRSVDIGSVPKASMQDVGDETIAALRRLVVGLLDLLERWGRTRYWSATATLAILIAALLSAFPALDAIDDGEWDVIHRVGRHPFTDFGYPPSSHAAKNLYRVTVPMLGEALGLSSIGYMALQALFGVLLIYGLLVALERSTGDRVSAFLFTLTACMTYGGVVSFVETRGFFDGVALALLVAALAWSHPVVVASTVFLACWTDERAILASGLLVAFFWFERAARDRDADGGRTPTAWRNVQIVAVVVGVGAHLVSRFAVARAFDLPQPTSGVGPSVLMDQINNVAVGIWTGLEGIWVALGLAVILLWRARMRLLGAFTVAVSGTIALAALSVVDITRSMAYLLPAVAVAAAVLAAMLRPRVVHRVALVCLALSAVWPIYYVGGKQSIWWYYPLPVHLVRFLTGAGS